MQNPVLLNQDRVFGFLLFDALSSGEPEAASLESLMAKGLPCERLAIASFAMRPAVYHCASRLRWLSRLDDIDGVMNHCRNEEHSLRIMRAAGQKLSRDPAHNCEQGL